jgi:virginiamycin B lyase
VPSSMSSTCISKIGQITTSGAVTEFQIPSVEAFPWGIAAGPDRALWFVEEGTSKIGRITIGGTFNH